MTKLHTKILLSASAVAILSVASNAAAQTTDAPVAQENTTKAPVTPENDIVVTGSRIARPEFETLQPTQVIGALQIENRGYTNVGQALSEIPAFGPPGNSGAGAQSSFGPGQTFVDFFALGSQRTLVLVNGRRFVSSNTASIFGPVAAGTQVDLNNIPATLVERVDTVAIGGAPIYGSDAISGTVNIILKRNYQGLRVEAQYGIAERGDAPDYRISAIAGKNFADGRGNITISGEYNNVRGITANARAVTSRGNFFGAAPAGSQFTEILYPNQRYTAFTAGGVPFISDDFGGIATGGAAIKNAAGQRLQFGADGSLVPLDVGTIMSPPFISSGGNGYNLSELTNLLTDSRRYIANAQLNYELRDNVRFFSEAWYVNSKGVNLIAQPVYNTRLFGPAGTTDGNLEISINNPYLNPADRALIAANLPAGQSTFYVGRANTDLTTGRAEATVETYRFVAGFDGSLNVGDRQFKWEVSGIYGRSQTTGRNFELVQQNFANALDAVSNGNSITCRPGVVNANISTLSSTCAPLNLFGSGRVSKEAQDYIFTISRPISINKQYVFNANISGPVFSLFGNDVSASVGYEHREEQTSFDPGEFHRGELMPDGSRRQFGRSVPIGAIAGKFNTDEVFGELVVPVVTQQNGLSWLKTLEFNGAARYVDNSLSGGDLTWSAGGRVSFVDGLTFRGNFTRSIRSPAITEVFNPSSPAFDTGIDPCDSTSVVNGSNPSARAANCRAAGINTSTFVSNFNNFTIPITVAGNRALKNEKANSWTVGGIFQPRFIPGLSLAVDWIDIKLSDAITSLNGTNLLAACYDSSSYPNNFCGSFDRAADGQLTTIRTGYFNAASIQTSGLTVTAAYRIPLERLGLGNGVFGVSGNYFYRHKLNTAVGVGDVVHNAGRIGTPKHAFTANATYSNDSFNALIQARYFGKSYYDPDARPNATNYPSLSPWVVVNSTIGFKVDQNFSLKLIVDNVFDRKPPFPAPAGGGSVTYFSGILGRYYRVAASVNF